MPKMPRQPIHGFARRVDDTVTRAMTILQNRLNLTTKPDEGSPLRRRRSQQAT
jgi:hypothetical protein